MSGFILDNFNCDRVDVHRYVRKQVKNSDRIFLVRQDSDASLTSKRFKKQKI